MGDENWLWIWEALRRAREGQEDIKTRTHRKDLCMGLHKRHVSDIHSRTRRKNIWGFDKRDTNHVVGVKWVWMKTRRTVHRTSVHRAYAHAHTGFQERIDQLQMVIACHERKKNNMNCFNLFDQKKPEAVAISLGVCVSLSWVLSFQVSHGTQGNN